MVWVHHLKIRAFIIDEIIWYSMGGIEWWEMGGWERIKMRFDKWLLRSENEISIKSFSMSAIINLSGIHDCSSLSLGNSIFDEWSRAGCFYALVNADGELLFFAVMLHKAQESRHADDGRDLPVFNFLLLFSHHLWTLKNTAGKLQDYWKFDWHLASFRKLAWNFLLKSTEEL